jgi:hypothetical protein
VTGQLQLRRLNRARAPGGTFVPLHWGVVQIEVWPVNEQAMGSPRRSWLRDHPEEIIPASEEDVSTPAVAPVLS